jgi:uncharacterized protein (TIGR02266 family)
MGKSALDWVRALVAPVSEHAEREPLDSDIFAAELGRVSLLHDGCEAETLRPGDARATANDDDPRFDEFERPTQLVRDARAVASKERRAQVRKPWITDLEFGEDVEFFTGLSCDISEGGLFVSTYQSIPLGTRLLVCFHLPDGTNVEARGEVRWARELGTDTDRPGVGIAFTDLPNETRHGISTLVESLPPLYYER